MSSMDDDVDATYFEYVSARDLSLSRLELLERLSVSRRMILMDLRGSQVASIYTLRVESRPKKGSVEAGEVRADIGVLCLRLTWG